MKKVFFISMLIITLFMVSCSETDDSPEVETLSQTEIDDLKFLREEEKLARDVYLFSYDKYTQDIFNNISQSEQQHMDSILTLLNRYNIDDPASTERGVFINQTLQNLYNDLIIQSDVSLLEALKVGATIEDLDINDIDDFEDRTDKTDILNTYDKLKCGSRNHMRNYYQQLINDDFIYIVQFISITELTEIINNSNEQCGN